MKPLRKDRMVIAYMPKKLHRTISKYCEDKQISLAKWAELAQDSLSTGKK